MFFPNLALKQYLDFGEMNISWINVSCWGNIRKTWCAHIPQINFMFLQCFACPWRILCQDRSLALEMIKHRLAIQALFWMLAWRKQKLLLLPLCLHFCPCFLKYILHWSLYPTSNGTVVCQKLRCGFVTCDRLYQGA